MAGRTRSPMTMTTVLLAGLGALSSSATALQHVERSNVLGGPTCNDGVLTIVARGTYEVFNDDPLDGIATAIGNAIPGSTYSEVIYPADVNIPVSNVLGVANTQLQMEQYFSACPQNKMVLLAYSQGAQAVEIALVGTNLTTPYMTGVPQDVGSNVAAIVLFGDLTRVTSQGVNAEGAAGCPVNGPLARTGYYYQQMEQYAGRLQEWCHAEDPVCCATGHNVSAHLDYFGSETTSKVVQFVQQKYSAALSSSTVSSSVGASTVPSTTSATVSTATTSAASTTTTPATATATTPAATPSQTTHSSAASGSLILTSVLPQRIGVLLLLRVAWAFFTV